MQELCGEAEALLDSFQKSVKALNDAQTEVNNATTALAIAEEPYGTPYGDLTYFIDENMRQVYATAKKKLLELVLERDVESVKTAELALKLADMEENYGGQVRRKFVAYQRANAWEGEFDGVP